MDMISRHRWNRYDGGLVMGFRRLVVVVLVTGMSIAVGCAQDDVVVEGPVVKSDTGGPDIATTATNKDEVDVVGTGVVGQTSRVISSQPDTGARVTLDHTLIENDQIEVKVTIRSFDNLYGIAAHLGYDPKALKLVSIQGHDVLNNFSHSSRTIAKESQAGRILLGAARFLTNAQPWSKLEGAAVDSALWVTLRFAVQADGEHVISFDPARSFAKDSTYKDVATTWGQLRITRQADAR